jgi:Domain of unknown function (DUF1844)
VSQPELTPDQVIDEIKKMKVSDLLLSTVTTLAQLGYAKLEEGTKDLEQARIAIDAIAALLPLIQDHVPAEIVRDLESVLANLQLAYVSASSKGSAGDAED